MYVIVDNIDGEGGYFPLFFVLTLLWSAVSVKISAINFQIIRYYEKYHLLFSCGGFRFFGVSRLFRQHVFQKSGPFFPGFLVGFG